MERLLLHLVTLIIRGMGISQIKFQVMLTVES
jgi:hypothetical protein